MSGPPLLRMIVQDLQPTPGRMRLALRITISTLITLVIVMAFRLPAALIALYFVMVIARDTPQQSLRWTAALAVAICCSLGLACLVVTTTGNDPVARMVSVAVVTFVAGVLVFSAKNTAVGSIGGYLYCIFIAYWEDDTAPSVILNRSVLTVVALIVALVVATFVEFVLHYRNPMRLLLEAERERLLALSALYAGLGEGLATAELRLRLRRCAVLSADGQIEMRRRSRAVAAQHPDGDQRSPFSAGYIALLSELLDLSTAYARQQLESPGAPAVPSQLKVSRYCRQLAQGEAVLPERSDDPEELKRVLSLLDLLSRERQRAGGSAGTSLILDLHEDGPFLPAGAWKDRAALAFACKVSLCATFCYVFYHAVGWPAISSCVTTVLITALSTTGPMKQRLFFRFVGVILGGVIVGLGTILLVFPKTDSIASLIVLTGVIAFAAAWVSAGRKLGYLGLQLGFCFYTVVFRGSAPETQVQSARDACIGIFLAIAVMWLVFDQLWPVRVTAIMRARLLDMVGFVRAFLTSLGNDPAAAELLDRARVTRHRAGQSLEEIRLLNDLAQFELGPERSQLVGQAQALQEVAVETAVIAWESLDRIYAMRDSRVTRADWTEACNAGLQTLEIVQQGLSGAGWQAGFGKGRYHAARRERGIAERVERMLLDLKKGRRV